MDKVIHELKHFKEANKTNVPNYKSKLILLKNTLHSELEKIYNEEIKRNVENKLKIFLNTNNVHMKVYTHAENNMSFVNTQEIQIENLIFKRKVCGNILPGHILKESRYNSQTIMTDVEQTVKCTLFFHANELDISFSNKMHNAKEFHQLFNMFHMNMDNHMKKYYEDWSIEDPETQEYFKDCNIINPSSKQCAFLDIVSYIFTELMPSILHNPNQYHDRKT